MQVTIKAELIKQKTEGNYTKMVFKASECPTSVSLTKLLTVTKLPNWQASEVQAYDEGYLTIKIPKPGVDAWYDGQNLHYFKSEVYYFDSFVPCN